MDQYSGHMFVHWWMEQYSGHIFVHFSLYRRKEQYGGHISVHFALYRWMEQYSGYIFVFVCLFVCLFFAWMLYVPVNSNGHVWTLLPFYGTFTQNDDAMTSNKCLKYNHSTKTIRLICMDGLT